MNNFYTKQTSTESMLYVQRILFLSIFFFLHFCINMVGICYEWQWKNIKQKKKENNLIILYEIILNVDLILNIHQLLISIIYVEYVWRKRKYCWCIHRKYFFFLVWESTQWKMTFYAYASCLDEFVLDLYIVLFDMYIHELIYV